jgi:two-component system LytT family sensor kinase
MYNVERVLRTKHLLWYNFLIWFLFCTLELIKTISFTAQLDLPYDITNFLQWPIAPFLCWWLLSIGVIQGYASTIRLNKKYFLLIHIMYSILFGTLHKLLTPIIAVLLDRLFFVTGNLSFDLMIPLSIITWYDVILSFALYWTIIGVLSWLNYYRNAQVQIDKRMELEAELSASHLKRMKTQLLPHFLFNAFNTIVMMIRKSKGDEAINMISSLSDMLRQSLKKETSQFVRLEEEINLLKSYLAIEAQRYKDRVTITWNLDDRLNKLVVPSFILQPIVENAFKHGISKNLGHSVLRIETRRIKDIIEMEIFNSGSTLPVNWEFQKDKGIGLANTSSRLMSLYKRDIRFLITEKEDGMSVILQLPVKEIV